MKYINMFREGNHVSEVYLCKNKQIQITKNGKEYGNLVLQDKTGTIDGKIWDLGSPGVGNFETMDYVYIDADVTVFQGHEPAEYTPDSEGPGRGIYSGRLSACIEKRYWKDVSGIDRYDPHY